MMHTIMYNVHIINGRDSEVGKATGYGLEGPGIESLWERDIPHTSIRALGSPRLLHSGCRVYFSGVKQPGRGVDHPHHLASRLKKK